MGKKQNFLSDERIYKRELAHRYPGAQLEVPIEITHATFQKVQYFDVLVDGGGPFEFKAVEALAPRHPAQLLHYLLLAELGHGKLVNLRNGSVDHEFVNTTLLREDRIQFVIEDSRFHDHAPGASRFREVLTGTDKSPDFAHLTGEDRKAILEILHDTKTDF